MKERLHIWWQKVKKPLEIIGVTTVVILIIGLVILIVAGYIFKWSWTGFEPETSIPQQHAKTLWDWLQLLIIPLVLAVGGYVFNLTVSRNEQQNTRLRVNFDIKLLIFWQLRCWEDGLSFLRILFSLSHDMFCCIGAA